MQRDLISAAVLMGLTAPAMSHDCRIRDGYLMGEYNGECDESTESCTEREHTRHQFVCR